MATMTAGRTMTDAARPPNGLDFYLSFETHDGIECGIGCDWAQPETGGIIYIGATPLAPAFVVGTTRQNAQTIIERIDRVGVPCVLALLLAATFGAEK